MTMQPPSTRKLNLAELNRLGRSVGTAARVLRGRRTDPGYAAPVPEEVGVQLTYRCNLRCTSCFQWSETGFFHRLGQQQARGELAPEVFEKLLFQTREARSNLYLWGGEPLVHRQWNELSRMLERDPRWTVICTNALMIERSLESLLRLSENLVLLISIDGLREQNDANRGHGTFEKIIAAVTLIARLKERGEYRGKLSLSLVLSDENVPTLYEFCDYCAGLPGIDSLYLVYPWYISASVAAAMDDYYEAQLAWLNPPPAAGSASWHSYTHHLSPASIGVLREQVAKIAAQAWDIRIRFQPAMDGEELAGFILGSARPAQGRSQCLALSSRLDVLADGTVSACKLFPELAVGNLNEQELAEIWHSERFRRVRGLVSGGLMPICSKCVLLYLHGA